MCCSNLLGCLLIIAGIGAAIVCLVGISIPVWATDESATSQTVSLTKTTYEGLWQKCTTITVNDQSLHCDHLWDDNVNSYTSGKRAVLGMCFIGLSCIIASAVVMALHLTLCETVEILTKIAGVLALAAGLFIVIGIIVYATDVKNDAADGSDLSVGFGLCLAAAVVCFIVGGLSFIVD